jgi:hypothetical protein
MKRETLPVKAAILTQPQYCLAADTDMVTANNFIARGIVRPSQVGARQVKNTRRFSIQDGYEGRVLTELIRHQQIGPADAAKLFMAAKVKALASKGGWIEHWARALDAERAFIPAFLVAAWVDDCYDAEIVGANQKSGWPDFSSDPKLRRFLKHPFLVLPLTEIFIDVRKKCLAMLAPDTTD